MELLLEFVGMGGAWTLNNQAGYPSYTYLIMLLSKLFWTKAESIWYLVSVYSPINKATPTIRNKVQLVTLLPPNGCLETMALSNSEKQEDKCGTWNCNEA